MTIRRTLTIQALIWSLILTYSFFMASRMPDQVPIHWDINGHADQMGSKWTSLFTGPLMIPFAMLLTWGLPKISPKNFTVERFERTWCAVMLLMTGLFAGLHVVIAEASMGGKFDMTRVMLAIIFAFFGVMGGLLGKVERNFWMGIRTPWTLASDAVWKATHESAGKLWLFAGIVGAILAMIGVPFAVMFTLLMVVALYPVAQSYFLYKKIEGNGISSV